MLCADHLKALTSVYVVIYNAFPDEIIFKLVSLVFLKDLNVFQTTSFKPFKPQLYFELQHLYKPKWHRMQSWMLFNEKNKGNDH